jgi:hypothetical protein
VRAQTIIAITTIICQYSPVVKTQHRGKFPESEYADAFRVIFCLGDSLRGGDKNYTEGVPTGISSGMGVYLKLFD